MTSITCFGGAEEIGGNKILLESSSTKIWLDFGLSFDLVGKYYAAFLNPRKFNGIGDYLEFGVIPDLKGLYRQDYVTKHNPNSHEPNPDYQGILISHSHLDHIGLLPLIRKDIPIYASQQSWSIMKSFDMTSSFKEYSYLKESFKFVEKRRGEGMKRLKGAEARIDRATNLAKEQFTIDHLNIESYPVDHSIPGATAYIIHTGKESIVYTGDFRFHGRRNKQTHKFLDAVKSVKPDVLIVEGTNIHEAPDISELEVAEKIEKLIKKTRQLVVVTYPSRDIDRMESFYLAAKEHGRTLLVSPSQAYLLQQLLKDNPDYAGPKLGEVGIFLPRKGWGLIDDPRYPPEYIAQDYRNTWEKEFLGKDYCYTAKQVREQPSEFVLNCGFYELPNLIDIKPPKGSIYIRSITEPFDDEMEFEFERMKAWLTHFGLAPLHQIHCSGHVSGPELIDFIQQVSPKKIIPIHTQHPGVFEKKLDFDIILPGNGEKIIIN